MRLVELLLFIEILCGGFHKLVVRFMRRMVESLDELPPHGFVARQGTEHGSWVYQ